MPGKSPSPKSLTVVGGTYFERCAFPHLDNLFGSGLRAAAAISQRGVPIRFHTIIGRDDQDALRAITSALGIESVAQPSDHTYIFDYLHSLAGPAIVLPCSDLAIPGLCVDEEAVLSFGMMEGTPIIHAKQAVYDPQSPDDPEPFSRNGSTAERLAIVCNQSEARKLADCDSLEDAGPRLLAKENAEIVVIKSGARGALVFTEGCRESVPAYQAAPQSLIGSGDVFSAVFAFHLMILGEKPAAAALAASQATAYYCATQVLPIPESIPISYQPVEWESAVPNHVYLAGPFFTPQGLWIIEETRHYLEEQGLVVFSPYHQVGCGSPSSVVPKDIQAIHACDILFALLDGQDPGTLFEIGYARALGKRVIAFHTDETSRDLTMLLGSECEIYNNYVSAIYAAAWKK